MRYRPLSPTGDYTLNQPFYVDSAQAVQQAIYTRLRLWLGEWFVDTTDGTPYLTGVLGERYAKNPDAAIKRRILGTQGVNSLTSYSSTFDGKSRTFTVNASVQSKYASKPLVINLHLSTTPPPVIVTPPVTPPPPPPPPPPTNNVTLAIGAILRPATTGSFAFNAQQLVITTSPLLPYGVVGLPYNAVLQALGTAPFNWAVTIGALDSGLSLNASSGVISGVPLNAETDSITVQVTDATGQSATKVFNLTVNVVTAITDTELRAAGYILVDDYGARADGVTDSTQAINNAILASVASFKPVWFKNGGDYMISGPIYCYRWMGTSASGVQMPSLIGASYPTRARVRIFDNCAFFSSAVNYMPVVVFRQFQDPTNSLPIPSQSSFDPLSDPPGWTENTGNNGFGGLFQNIDLHYGLNNVGAAGLMAQFAQSAHIQHVSVTATGGGFCGFLALPVEGSSAVDLSVTGGQYGVYGNSVRGLGGNPTYIQGLVGSHISGFTCIGQTVACIATGGFMSSTVCGFNLAPAAGALSVQFNNPGYRAGDGGLFLHDGQITMSGGGNPLAVDNSANPQVNLGLRNVYIAGTSNLVRTGGNPTITGSGTWPLITTYHAATNLTNNAGGGTSPTQSIVDGSITSAQEPYKVVNGSNNYAPPSDLISRHIFAAPQIDNGAYIDITKAPYNCISGDNGNPAEYDALYNGSATDCYAKITQAISDAATAGHNRVFIPRGSFCVSAAPVLGAATIMFGTSLAMSQIMPILSWVPLAGNPPVIDTVSNAAGTTQLVNVCVVRPMTRGTVTTYNGNSVLTGNRFNGVNWKVGRNSIMAAVFLENDYQSNGYASYPKQILSITGNGGGRFYSMAYREEDYCNQDTQMIPLQISGTSEPIWIYGNNVEFGGKRNSTGPGPYTNIQIANASNIRMFQTKREGAAPTVVITNSSNVAFYVAGKLGGGVDDTVPLANYPGATYRSQGYVDATSTNILITDWSVFLNDSAGTGQKQFVDITSGVTLDSETQMCVYKKGVIDDSAMARSVPAPGNTSLAIAATLSNVATNVAVTVPSVGAWAFRSVGAATYSWALTISPALPPGYQAGDLLVLCAGEYFGADAPPTIAGWQQVSASSVASGTSIFLRIATGTSADQPTFGYRGSTYDNFGMIAAYSGGPATLTGIVNSVGPTELLKVNTAGALPVAGISAPSQNNCLVLNFALSVVPLNTSTGIGTAPGLTVRGSGFATIGSGTIAWCLEDQIQTTAAAVSANYHSPGWTDDTSYGRESQMVALNV